MIVMFRNWIAFLNESPIIRSERWCKGTGSNWRLQLQIRLLINLVHAGPLIRILVESSRPNTGASITRCCDKELVVMGPITGPDDSSVVRILASHWAHQFELKLWCVIIGLKATHEKLPGAISWDTQQVVGAVGEFQLDYGQVMPSKCVYLLVGNLVISVLLLPDNNVGMLCLGRL